MLQSPGFTGAQYRVAKKCGGDFRIRTRPEAPRASLGTVPFGLCTTLSVQPQPHGRGLATRCNGVHIIEYNAKRQEVSSAGLQCYIKNALEPFADRSHWPSHWRLSASYDLWHSQQQLTFECL